MSFSFSIAGRFVGVDFRPSKWRLRIETFEHPTEQPFRLYRSTAFWLGPVCLMRRGRFVDATWPVRIVSVEEVKRLYQ